MLLLLFEIIVLEEKMTTLTNRKLPSAIPIFSVRHCINPNAAAKQSFSYATHDFDAKTDHGQIDLPTGIFTVQTPGIYQLNFNSTIHIDSTYLKHCFHLRVDGACKASSLNVTTSETEIYQSVTISALLQLNKGQNVGVFILESGRIYENAPGFVTLFSCTLFVDQSIFFSDLILKW